MELGKLFNSLHEVFKCKIAADLFIFIVMQTASKL